MKQLTCEMCGSTDLLKDGGVFVCQACGCKYSVEEAKKMMVEGTVEVTGTVKVDTSKKLENLYTLARRARDTDNVKDASKYYYEIAVEDPNSWEAAFYSVYFTALDCRIGEIKMAAQSISNNIVTVCDIIQTYVPKEEQKRAYTECLLRTFFAGQVLFDISKRTYVESNYNDALTDFMDRADACLTTVIRAGIASETVFSDYELAHSIYLKAIDLCNSSSVIKNKVQVVQDRINTIKPKISKLEENLGQELAEEKNIINRLMMVEHIFPITGMGSMITGTVERGTISINETIIINNKSFVVSKLESSNKFINTACAGTEVGMLIKNATKNDVKVGDMVYKEESSKTENYMANDRDGNFSTQSRPSVSSQSGGCYVATAVYGSYDCPQVWTLRRFRDNTLAKTWYGRTFIHTYYAISPALVKWFGHTEWFKTMWRGVLDTMVENLNANGVEDTPYNDKQW